MTWRFLAGGVLVKGASSRAGGTDGKESRVGGTFVDVEGKDRLSHCGSGLVALYHKAMHLQISNLNRTSVLAYCPPALTVDFEPTPPSVPQNYWDSQSPDYPPCLGGCLIIRDAP